MADKAQEDDCKCPYCDGQVEPKPPFCEPCGKEFELCRDCGKPVPRGAQSCPHCNPQD